jgi:hypothetical protein
MIAGTGCGGESYGGLAVIAALTTTSQEMQARVRKRTLSKAIIRVSDQIEIVGGNMGEFWMSDIGCPLL